MLNLAEHKKLKEEKAISRIGKKRCVRLIDTRTGVFKVKINDLEKVGTLSESTKSFLNLQEAVALFCQIQCE